MNKSVIAISISVIGIISLFFLLSIFWILYFSWGDKNAVQSSLATTGALFSTFATLGAAIIAAFLFNDWKAQHNKQVTNDFALRTYIKFKQTESSLLVANDILIAIFEDSESIYDDERPIDNNDPVAVRNKNRISKLFDQLSLVEDEFKLFISELRDFSIVTNREDEIQQHIKKLMHDFSELSTEIESYGLSEYKQALEIYDIHVDNYLKLISNSKDLIVNSLLKELQE